MATILPSHKKTARLSSNLVWHDSCIWDNDSFHMGQWFIACVPWLVYHFPFTYEDCRTLLKRCVMCDITHAYGTMIHFTWDKDSLHVCHDSFAIFLLHKKNARLSSNLVWFFTWPMHMGQWLISHWDNDSLHVWHDSYVCDMWCRYMCALICSCIHVHVSRLIHTSRLSFIWMSHD